MWAVDFFMALATRLGCLETDEDRAVLRVWLVSTLGSGGINSSVVAARMGKCIREAGENCGQDRPLPFDRESEWIAGYLSFLDAIDNRNSRNES
jgi:hypothetical protein